MSRLVDYLHNLGFTYEAQEAVSLFLLIITFAVLFRTFLDRRFPRRTDGPYH